MKYIVLAFCLLGLSGCLSTGNMMSSDAIQRAYWSRPVSKFVPEQTYCYATIGEVECFTDAQPREKRRLVNAYETGPQSYYQYQMPTDLRHDLAQVKSAEG